MRAWACLTMARAFAARQSRRHFTQCPIRDLYILLEHGRPKDARVFPGGHMGMTPQTWPTVINWVKAQADG